MDRKLNNSPLTDVDVVDDDVCWMRLASCIVRFISAFFVSV